MIYKNNTKACLYVIEICASYFAIESWFLWIGILNLYYAKKGTLSQAFSCKFCEFLHNDGFWDFIQQIFGWMLLNFLLLNRLFVNVIKIINLTILKLYPVKLTRILIRFERYFSHPSAQWREKYHSKRSLLKHTCS